MIIVNNERVELPKKFKDELQNKLRNGVNVNYLKSKIKKAALYTLSGTDTGRTIEETPKMRSFPMERQLLLDLDPASPNYLKPDNVNGTLATICIASNVEIKNGDIVGFKKVKFKKATKLNIQDYETYYFLYYISDKVKNGLSGKYGRNHHYEIEDLKAEAVVKVANTKAEAKAKYLLTGEAEETGISDAKLVELAYAYGIMGAKKFTREELAVKIISKIEVDQKTKTVSAGSDLSGFEYFNHIVSDKTETTYRVVMNKAIEEDVFGYDEAVGKWRYINDKTRLGQSGYFGVAIEGVNPKLKPQVGLLEKLRTDNSFFQVVYGLLQEVKAERIAVTESAPEKAASPEEPKSPIEQLKDLAKTHKQQGNYSEAIEIYDRLIEEDPANKQTYAMQRGKLKTLSKAEK